MKQVRTSLNNTQYHDFQELCKRLDESEYEFVKKAINERKERVKAQTLPEKINRLLWEDH